VITLITPAMASQHFDAFDDGVRNRVQVDEVAMAVVRERIRSQAQTVGHRQRGLHGETAQRGGVGAGREVETGVPALLDGAGVARRETLNRFRNRVDTAFGQRVSTEHSHRRRRLRVSAAQDGASNDHFLHRLIFGGWCFLCESHGGQCPTGRNSGGQQRTANRRADQVFTEVT
jgi:hypothetical protein